MHHFCTKHLVPALLLLDLIIITHCKVLLISMDGFGWDYITRYDTPNFDEFARTGTRARYITGSFVTKSFPTHYTMATGLYDESHGIVGNDMYDPVLRRIFNKGSKETFWWDGGEPIWVTVQRYGLRSGVYYWPGSESVVKGKLPNYWKAYDEEVPFSERIDTVMTWLSDDTYNVSMALLYFHEPDETGHKFGPRSPEMMAKVMEMDAVLGEIVNKMERNNLWRNVDVIVTSDHGMTAVDQANRGIDLSRYIDLNDIEQIPEGDGAVVSILPKVGKEDELFQKLSAVDHMTVYRKDEIPERWHYKNNPRVLPLFLVADEGWMIGQNLSEYIDPDRGNHGFDNALTTMKPIFFAKGPHIRRRYSAEPFYQVDIYPLMCELLDIQCAENDGSLSKTKQFILKTTSGTEMISLPLINILMTVVFTISIMFI